MAPRSCFPNQTQIASVSPERSVRVVDQRTLKLKSTTESYVQDGVLWSISGWRKSKISSGIEFLIRYSRAEPQLAPVIYAYAMVNKDEMPQSLIEGYHFPRLRRLPSHNPCRRGRRRIKSIQDFAWKTDDLSTFEDPKTVLEQNGDQIVENLLCNIEWTDGRITWESGLTVNHILGRAVFIQCIRTGLEKAVRKWRHIQTSNSTPLSSSPESAFYHAKRWAAYHAKIWENDGDLTYDDGGDEGSGDDPESPSVGGKAPPNKGRTYKWEPTKEWIEVMKGSEPASAIFGLFTMVDRYCERNGIIPCKDLLVKSNDHDTIRVPREIDNKTVNQLFQHLVPKDTDITSLPTLGLSLGR